jgi:hypothetical protein
LPAAAMNREHGPNTGAPSTIFLGITLEASRNLW